MSDSQMTKRDDELASLAATQCHGGYGDAFGNWRCKYQDEIKRLTELNELYKKELKEREHG